MKKSISIVLLAALLCTGLTAKTQQSQILLSLINKTNNPLAYLQHDQKDLDQLVKDINVAAIMQLVDGKNDYLTAASNVFKHILRPYYNAKNDFSKAAILQKLTFSCVQNDNSPAGFPGTLEFPVKLNNNVIWNRYLCTFSIHDANYSYTSPSYRFNQLDINYKKKNIAPAVAFQNYQTNDGKYSWMGKYVQPLNIMLRDKNGNIPINAVAGINAGYDYRVDLWKIFPPSDNICPPRYGYLSEFLGKTVTDPNGFYTKQPNKQCKMDSNYLPTCLNKEGSLLIANDLGDSLVYLPATVREHSWQSTALQSYNCGGAGETHARAVMAFYNNAVDIFRTMPSKNNIAALNNKQGIAPDSAIGAGPMLIQNSHFVYDDPVSEEGMGLDNYEIGGASGVGYTNNSDGNSMVYIVNIDGSDNKNGMHDWLMGLYFMNQLKAQGAISLGNGGDATLWINPQQSAIQQVLDNQKSANYAYFSALFKNNSNSTLGIVSNCQFSHNMGTYSAGCNARPVHDGLFVWNY